MSAREEINRLTAICKGATEGPWEQGDRYAVAGITGRDGPDRCVWCASQPAWPVIWTGRTDINGTVMPAHVHRRNEPSDPYDIVAWYDDGRPLHVLVGRNDWGPVIHERDAAFIVAARTALPAALACLTELLGQSERGVDPALASPGYNRAWKHVRQVIDRHFPGTT